MTDGTNTVTAPDASKASERLFIMVTFDSDPGLFNTINSDAEAQNIGRATLVRQLLADKYGVILTVSTGGGGKKKYDSNEDREAARAKQVADRTRLSAVLMSSHKLKMAALAAGKPIDEAAFEAQASAAYDLKQAKKADNLAADAAEKAAAAAPTPPATA